MQRDSRYGIALRQADASKGYSVFHALTFRGWFREYRSNQTASSRMPQTKEAGHNALQRGCCCSFNRALMLRLSEQNQVMTGTTVEVESPWNRYVYGFLSVALDCRHAHQRTRH